ncbi:hypothetical protein [Haliangium sp.]|uniref:hypothetical protein n=1 Tax=Haliangium sp. TaxID=2663208 RepID=UPI003D13B112
MHACRPAGQLATTPITPEASTSTQTPCAGDPTPEVAAGPARWARTPLGPSLALVLAVALSAAGCGDPLEASRPKPEIVPSPAVQLELPEVPAFEIPGLHPDGTHSVREMRLNSARLLESKVQVKGFVTWIYDCVSELQGPDDRPEDVRKKIAEDPTLCQRPHFYLGDSADTSGERSIWIVDVPRKLRSDELRTMGRAERAAMPKPPKIDIGDEVIVTGAWKRESSGGFSNSLGLLEYEDLKNLTLEAK